MMLGRIEEGNRKRHGFTLEMFWMNAKVRHYIVLFPFPIS